MISIQQQQARPLPSGLIIVASIVIVFHLFALVVLVTAAPSGPWPSPMGFSDFILEPQFAGVLNRFTGRYYLQPLHLIHNYHFVSNRVEVPSVYFEVTLKDDKGNVMQTLEFPEKNVNSWVAYRQRILAQNLGDDIPVQPPEMEKISAPGRKMRTLNIWDTKEGETIFRLRSISEHLVPRDRPVSRPTRWSQLLAQSYMRYLCRQHEAASATLIRHSREPIYPMVLVAEQISAPEAMEIMKSNFGEYRAEK